MTVSGTAASACHRLRGELELLCGIGPSSASRTAARRLSATSRSWARRWQLLVLGIIILTVASPLGSSSSGITESIGQRRARSTGRSLHETDSVFSRLNESTGSSDREHPEGGKMEWTIVSMLVLVILLSMIFEGFQNWLYKRFEDNEDVMNMITTLFKELTILGFVSLTAMILVKTGIMAQVQHAFLSRDHPGSDGRRLTDEGQLQAVRRLPTILAKAGLHVNVQELVMQSVIETNHLNAASIRRRLEVEAHHQLLQELFEEVHILIFMVMICFILLVSIMLIHAVRLGEFFSEAEVVNPQKYLEDFESLAGFRRWTDCGYSKAMYVSVMQLRIFRREFFHPSYKSARRRAKVRPASFTFHKYLFICLSDMIVELIEISPATWCIIMLLLVLFKPAIHLRGNAFFLFMTARVWMQFFLLLAVTYDARQKCLMCLPGNCPTLTNPFPDSFNEKKTKPSYCKLPPSRLNYPRCTKWIYGTESPTTQDQIFWCWKKGPVLAKLSMQVLLFLEGCCLAVYFRFCPGEMPLVLQLAMWLPIILGLRFVWPYLLMFNGFALYTGEFKNEDAIFRVMNIHAHKQLEEYRDFIVQISVHARIFDISRRDQLEYEDWENKYKERFTELSPSVRTAVMEAFRAWDSSNNNALDEKEFVKCLVALGRYTEVMAARMAKIWFRGEHNNIFEKRRSPQDSDHAGECTALASKPSKGMELTPDDFKVFYAQMLELEEKPLSEKAVREWIKGVGLDEDGDNLISIKEFREREPLGSTAKFCNLNSDEAIRGLFKTIRNPKNEDEEIEHITFNQLALWMTRLMSS